MLAKQQELQHQAARMTEDQEQRRLEAARRNEPQEPPLQENKTQVDTPTKQECPLESLKRGIEDQTNHMTADESEQDAAARRVRTNT